MFVEEGSTYERDVNIYRGGVYAYERDVNMCRGGMYI